jgi:hypothetical protein
LKTGAAAGKGKCDPMQIGSGNFQLLALDCGSGANCLREQLAGNGSCVTKGKKIPTEPGGKAGPVAQGLNTRFGEYDGPMKGTEADYPPDTVTHWETEKVDGVENNLFWFDDYDARQGDPDSHDYPTTGDPKGVPGRRMVGVPIGPCTGEETGRSEIEVLDVGCVLLTRPAEQTGHQEVYGQLVPATDGKCLASGAIAEDPTEDDDFALEKIVLYKDPESQDS